MHAVGGFKLEVMFAQDLTFTVLCEGELPSFGKAVSGSAGRLLINIAFAFKDLTDLNVVPKFDLIFHVLSFG